MPPQQTERFGKLTPVSETYRAPDKRYYMDVECDCGRRKRVLRQSLVSGATKSCGRGPCRDRAIAGSDAAIMMPRAMTLPQIEKAWAAYTHELPSQRRNLAQLAKRHKVSVNTLTSIFQRVRRCGGIDEFKAVLDV